MEYWQVYKQYEKENENYLPIIPPPRENHHPFMVFLNGSLVVTVSVCYSTQFFLHMLDEGATDPKY